MKIISTNPSKNYEVIGEVEISTEKEIKVAVLKAKEAFLKWSSLSISERAKILSSFIKISENNFERIAKLIALETGRPIRSARDNVSGGIKYFKYYINNAFSCLRAKTTFKNKKEIHRVYREPWGVVAAICPWNYPYMNISWQCGQALLSGNTIVYKNSRENILFSKLVNELITKSDIPEGVFNVIYGDSNAGRQLINQDIDMISFTGSSKIGQLLTKIAAEKFIPIMTELGGSSPCIIFDDIDIDSVVEKIYDRRFINAGQSCSAIKRLIVHKRKFNELVNKLCKIISTKKVGDALDEDTDIGPLVSKCQLDLLEKQIETSIKKGAKVEIGGHKPKNLQGAYYSPTILTKISTDMSVWKEETFGPVLPIVSFSTEQEAIYLANDTEYGLNAYILTNNKKLFNRVALQLKAGSIAQNNVDFFDPRNPFGGYKKSGMGRIHGEWGFDDFTQVKLISEESNDSVKYINAKNI